MNVTEMIAALELIEDKTLPVCLADWSEEYVLPGVATDVVVENGKTCDGVIGSFVLIDCNPI